MVLHYIPSGMTEGVWARPLDTSNTKHFRVRIAASWNAAAGSIIESRAADLAIWNLVILDGVAQRPRAEFLAAFMRNLINDYAIWANELEIHYLDDSTRRLFEGCQCDIASSLKHVARGGQIKLSIFSLTS